MRSVLLVHSSSPRSSPPLPAPTAPAGTSGCWDGILDSNVVFPADMPEVVAVTGVSYPAAASPAASTMEARWS